jgi:site-specific recombinase XerD
MNKQLSLFDYNKTNKSRAEEHKPSPTVRRTADSLSVSNLLNPDTSVSAALEVWLQSRRRAGLSENTLKNYRIDIRLLAEYAGAGAAVGEFTTKTLNDYLEWMRHQRRIPCSTKTLDRRITSLKSFFRWLTPASGLTVNPADAVVNVSVRSPLPTVLTELEISQAQHAAEKLMKRKKKADMRPYILFTFLLHTGLRKGETVRLVSNHLVLENSDQPYLYVRYSDKRHIHKERRVELNSDWVEYYTKYSEHYDVKERVFPWSVRLLEYRLEDISNSAGLTKHISFEMLRWTCALRDFRDGMEPEKLRRKLGLSKVQWGEVRRKIRKLLA